MLSDNNVQFQKTETLPAEGKELRRIKRDIVGVLVQSSDGKFLLGKHQNTAVYNGRWCVIGGGVDPGESKVQAVVRETLEESGIDISESELSLVDASKTGESGKTLKDTGERVLVEMTFFDFQAILNQTSQEVELKPEEREFSDMNWFGPEEIGQLELSPPTKQLLQHLRII